jgi:hypothetical protein
MFRRVPPLHFDHGRTFQKHDECCSTKACTFFWQVGIPLLNPHDFHVGNRAAVCVREGCTMLNWALAFFLVALVAAFGFAGIALAAAGVVDSSDKAEERKQADS